MDLEQFDREQKRKRSALRAFLVLFGAGVLCLGVSAFMSSRALEITAIVLEAAGAAWLLRYWVGRRRRERANQA